MLTIHARSYENGEPLRITLRGGRIRSVEPAWPKGAVDDWPGLDILREGPRRG